MLVVMLQMAALILCGVLWRALKPGGIEARSMRTALTSLVYYLFLPALVLLVLWQAPLGLNVLKISLVASIGVLTALVAIGWICTRCGMDRATKGAVMLAAAFPNVTYLGLPVLESTLGKAARSIAIQYDLFACTPLLLSVGVWVAIRHGDVTSERVNWKSLAQVPAIWAAIIAVLLNLIAVPFPENLRVWLQMLANGVVPLMLISLGLSLYMTREHLGSLRSLVPLLGVKLLMMPLVVWGMTNLVGLQGMPQQAAVLEAAMPSMVLGMVLCDRYGLNSTVYAAAVTLSTAVSFFTLSGLFSVLVR